MITYIKQYFCLLISAFLLISNTQVYAQEITAPNIISQAEIEELSALAKEVNRKYARTLANIRSTSEYIEYVQTGQSKLVYRNPYAMEIIVSGSYKKYYEEIYNLEEVLKLFQSKMSAAYAKYLAALPEGTYLQKVTANYINGHMDDLFRTQNHYLDKLLSISDIIAEHPEIEDISPYLKSVSFSSSEAKRKYLETQYAKAGRVRNEFIKDLAYNQIYYQKAFSQDADQLLNQLKRAESSFSKDAVEFFSKKTHTAEEVLQYFAARLPEEQKAILFALKTTDDGMTITHLIPYVRYYLKQTNRRLWKMEKFSAQGLKTALAKMTLTERAAYLDNLLDFSPETRVLRTEIKQAEKTAGKKIINRSSIKLSGTFMALGALLVAATITEISADNHFNNNTYSAAKSAEIHNKMERGELISLNEMLNYYTDERNLSKIAKNPFDMLQALEAAITLNEYLDALQIESEPSNMYFPQEEINNSFDKHLNKIDLDRVTSKTGTL